MKRVLAVSWLLLVLGTLAVAVEPKQEKEKEGVVVKITVPKTVEFKSAAVPGGGTGTFKVEIIVENKSKEGLPFSRHKLDFDVLDEKGQPVGTMFWNWNKPAKGVADIFLLPSGETKKLTEELRFNTWTPENGKKLTVVLKAFDKEAKADLEAKVQK